MVAGDPHVVFSGLMLLMVLPVIFFINVLWKYRYNVSVLWLVFALFLTAFRAILEASSTIITNESVSIFSVMLIRPIGMLMAVFAFFFVIEYSTARTLNKWFVGLFLIVPAITQVGMWTRPDLFFSVLEVGTGGVVHWSYGGPFGRLHQIYIAVMLAGMIIVLLRDYVDVSEQIRKKQILTILLASAILIPVSFVSPYVPDYMNPEIYGVVLFLSIITYSLKRYGLFTTRLHEKDVLDEIDDAVVTLNSQGNIIYINERAKQLLHSRGDAIGKPYSALGVLEGDEDPQQLDGQVLDYDGTTIEVSVSPILYGRGLDGTIVLLHDVTELKNREEELDFLRKVQSRVLRHNIRNVLSVIRGNATNMRANLDDERREHVDKIVDASDKLSSISRKARFAEEIVDAEDVLIEYDLRMVIEQTVDTVQKSYPDLEVAIDGPETCFVYATNRLNIAIQNLLENAVVHNDSENPRVSIEISTGDTVSVVISDNGPGIPEHEIEVLRKEGETPLQHGSGIGLWLVKWIADRSNADLRFDTGDGTEVTLELKSLHATSPFS